jgi:hypothetical protein
LDSGDAGLWGKGHEGGALERLDFRFAEVEADLAKSRFFKHNIDRAQTWMIHTKHPDHEQQT